MPDYREPTDETIETTAERIPPDQPAQPQQQVAQYAPGGGVIPAPARTAGQVVDLLEDGQLSADLHHELKELAAQIRAVSNTTGSKAKGTATLTLKLESDSDGAIRIEGVIKTKAPDLPRRRSILWQDDANDFTRFPPNQTQMFGTAPIRRVG